MVSIWQWRDGSSDTGEGVHEPGNLCGPTAASVCARHALTAVCPNRRYHSRSQDRGCGQGVGQSNRRGVGEGVHGPGNLCAPTAASVCARHALTAVCPAGTNHSRNQDRGCGQGVGQSNRRGVGEGVHGPGNLCAPTAASVCARHALTAVCPNRR